LTQEKAEDWIWIYDALYNHQMTEDQFHNDESSWKVFETVDNKIGNRWWLWVSLSVSVVYFQIAPGRGANVPLEYFNLKVTRKNIQQQKIIVICNCSPRPFDMPCQSTASATVAHGYQNQLCFVE